jgi:hypothetical protein
MLFGSERQDLITSYLPTIHPETLDAPIYANALVSETLDVVVEISVKAHREVLPGPDSCCSLQRGRIADVKAGFVAHCAVSLMVKQPLIHAQLARFRSEHGLFKRMYFACISVLSCLSGEIMANYRLQGKVFST